MSTPDANSPAIRRACEVRQKRERREQAHRNDRRPAEELFEATRAFAGWYPRLEGELGRPPTEDEQAERFDGLAETMCEVVGRHRLDSF